MTLTVGVAEAHNRLSELIDLAQAGTRVVISRRGVPVAEVTPLLTSNRWASRDAMIDWLEGRRRHSGGRSFEDIMAQVREERDSWE